VYLPWRGLAFDPAYFLPATGRFVIIDKYEIAGGGIISRTGDDKKSNIHEKVLMRNYKWERSSISPFERAEKYNQKAALVLITGKKEEARKEIARALEKKLFTEGKLVYFLGIGNVLYGIDADIKTHNGGEITHSEHIRRLSEVSHILLDSGIILIVTAIELMQDDLETVKTVVNSDNIHTVWLGREVTSDIKYDQIITDYETEKGAALLIKEKLQDKGIIFKP